MVINRLESNGYSSLTADSVEGLVAELYFLAKSFAGEEEIEEALEIYQAYIDGTEDPHKVFESSPESSHPNNQICDYAKAYLQTVDIMES